MRERGHGGVRIEPDADAKPMFPIGDDDCEHGGVASSVATARCPHCQAVISFPGFDTILRLLV
jgi:hypothetical protein